MALRDRFRGRKDAPPPTDKEIGRSGTVNTRGFLSSDERNASLVWPRNLEIFDEMRRTDPTCRWMLSLVSTPIRAADWEVPAIGPSDEDREIAAAVEHCLFHELEGGFDEFLRHALLYLAYGHQVFETVAELREVEFSYLNELGEEVEVTREMFVISRLAPRLSRTIQRWIPRDDNPADLMEIEQWLPDGGGPKTIPADRLVIFTNEREGDDWRGTSVLRSAYVDYEYKRKLENLEGIAYERSAGLPVGYPAGDADEEQVEGMEEALKAIRQGEMLYLVMPGPKQSSDNPEGWLVEELGITGDAQRSPDEAIKRHEASMARNVMAEFMRLGHDQTGARATSETQQDPYYQGVAAHASYIEDVVTEQIIAKLVSWNYQTSREPTIKAGDIQAKNVEVLGKAAAALMTAGGITADDELENYLRRVLKAPEKQPQSEDEEPEVPVVPLVDGEEAPEDDVSAPPPKPGEEGAPPPLPAPEGAPETKPVAAAESRSFIASRALRPEETFVALAEISHGLDSLTQHFVDAVDHAAVDPIRDAERQIRQAVQAGSPELVTKIEVDPGPIEQALVTILGMAYLRGRREVASELRRQKGSAFQEDTSREEQQHRVRNATATATAAAIAQAATRAARQRGIREIETGTEPTGPGFDAVAAARAEATRAASPSVNSVFADGRKAEQLARAEEIDYSVYSAILDTATCPACTEADGEGGPPGEKAPPGGFEDLPVPNPDCEGGGRCRCMYIPVIE